MISRWMDVTKENKQCPSWSDRQVGLLTDEYPSERQKTIFSSKTPTAVILSRRKSLTFDSLCFRTSRVWIFFSSSSSFERQTIQMYKCMYASKNREKKKCSLSLSLPFSTSNETDKASWAYERVESCRHIIISLACSLNPSSSFSFCLYSSFVRSFSFSR